MLHQKVIWQHVEKALLDIENTGAYYAGGTLSLPLGVSATGVPRGICLHVDGTGFVLSDIKNTRVYLPDYITDLVRDIYVKTKGYTNYYLEKTSTTGSAK